MAISKKFLKLDSGKPRISLVPPEAVLAMASVFSYGAIKYAANNWKKCDDWDRVYDSLQRHLLAWRSGQDLDLPPVGSPHREAVNYSGLPHLHHAICNLAMLIWATKKK